MSGHMQDFRGVSCDFLPWRSVGFGCVVVCVFKRTGWPIPVNSSSGSTYLLSCNRFLRCHMIQKSFGKTLNPKFTRTRNPCIGRQSSNHQPLKYLWPVWPIISKCVFSVYARITYNHCYVDLRIS